jgi:hypothetical protein
MSSGADTAPQPVPGLRWHENGRYLTKEECLTHISKFRSNRGESAEITPSEQEGTLEAAHELLTLEMDASANYNREQYNLSVERIVEQQRPRPSRAILFFLIGAIGLLAPYIAHLEFLPSWLVWLFKGSGGEGQAWQFLGALMLAVGAIELLRLTGERLNLPSFGDAALLIWRLLMGLFLLLCVVLVVLFGVLLIGMLALGVADLMPTPISTLLRSFDRGIAPISIGSLGSPTFQVGSLRSSLPAIM